MKKLLMMLVLASLTACATITPSNVIYFTPTATPATEQIGNGKSFTLVSKDARSSDKIALITESDAPDISLNASQAVQKTYETALFQQFLSQGFHVTRDSNNTVSIVIQKTFAKVTKGEVDYTIDAEVGLQVIAQSPTGKLVKTYNGFVSQSGAFDPTLSDIQDVLNKAATRVLSEIADDQELQQYMAERF